MIKIAKLSTLLFASVLAACGGGGGDPGQSDLKYTITLRAEKTQLPVNIGGYPAGQGVYAPFTTTLYVDAREGSKPIPDGEEDIFACNVVQGLDSGSLYYLDGDEEHEDEDGNPLAYRSITLGANSGGASFHFHAQEQAGVARITCTVTNPVSSQRESASVDITVGAPTGMAASVAGVALYPVLGTQGNTSNLRVSTAIDAYVLDDANQPLPAPRNANLQVSIRPVGDAATGARLVAGAQSGSTLQVKTIGGVGLFALSSGPNVGPILLEMVADRSDNDVTNGIQMPITALLVVQATDRVAPTLEPLEITTTSVDAEPTNGVPFSFVLEAEGGLPPYTWSALSSLPAGLSLSSSGVISGTPNMREPGDVSFAVRVVDSAGNVDQANFTMTIAGSAIVDPLTINLSGCGSDINTACPLAGATAGQSYLYALTASGGPATGVVTWAGTALPGWLTLSAQGILVGTAPAAPGGCGNNDFFVTATKGTLSTTRKVRITVAGAGCP